MSDDHGTQISYISTQLQQTAELTCRLGFGLSPLFPLALSAVVIAAVLGVAGAIDVSRVPLGPELSARLTWAVAAMLFLVFFAFAAVVFNVLMFRCGRQEHAIMGMLLTTSLGLIAVVVSYVCRSIYVGPLDMWTALEASAFRHSGVRIITGLSTGCAIWATLLVLAASAVILANEVTTPADLSRQLRASRILVHTAAALLIVGASQTTALHKWPVHSQSAVLAPQQLKVLESGAMAISTTVGTVFSLVLAAAYLPLGILLRQRAYRVIQPWERTESWLAIHGFALVPTQQLAKLLLILSPLIAGGPVTYLISLLGQRP